MKKNKKKIVILGASGYIGQRLVKKFIKKNEKNEYELHLVSRNNKKLKHFIKEKNVYLYDFDLIDTNIDKIKELFSNTHTIYYLIHSMSKTDSTNFLEKESKLAELISKTAASLNVLNIIYLGGLDGGDDTNRKKELSTHLKSRKLTGDILRKYTKNSITKITEYKAGIIIGAGGSSFEIIRTLATKLPIIPVFFKEEGLCEPIFVDNIIEVLYKTIYTPELQGHIIDLGNGEKNTYSKLVQLYAKNVLNKNLYIINLSFLSFIIKPKLIGKVIAFMTGQPRELVVPLIYGAENDAITRKEYRLENFNNGKNIIKKTFDTITSYKLAANREKKGNIKSVWDIPSDLSNLKKKQNKFFYTTETEGVLYADSLINISDCLVDSVFTEVKNVGTKKSKYWGYYPLWLIRGYIDKFFGGPGIGNYSSINRNELHIGDKIDFWTIEQVIDAKHSKELRLVSEMKVPGEAWLQFRIFRNKEEDNHIFLIRAFFAPHDIFGYIYWYSLFFIHKFIFDKMVINIIKNSIGLNNK